MSGQALSFAAEALAGTRFRLHGRDPASGLDCVGVLGAALKAIDRPAPLPQAYSLRSRAIAGLEEIARKCGLIAVCGAREPGDVLLAKIGACQFHLLVTASDGRVVHAHAGLGRVIVGPLPPDWAIVGQWRLSEQLIKDS